jgi:chromosome segregation ATPase
MNTLDEEAMALAVERAALEKELAGISQEVRSFCSSQSLALFTSFRQRDAVSFALRAGGADTLTLDELAPHPAQADAIAAERRALAAERAAIEAALAQVDDDGGTLDNDDDDDDDDSDDEWDQMSPQEQALRLDIERCQLQIEERETQLVELFDDEQRTMDAAASRARDDALDAAAKQRRRLLDEIDELERQIDSLQSTLAIGNYEGARAQKQPTKADAPKTVGMIERGRVECWV